MSLGNESVISATLEDRPSQDHNPYFAEGAAIKLCSMIAPAVRASIDLLLSGKYNDLIVSELPYQFRTGVIRRSDLWEYEPDAKERAYDGLSEETVQQFTQLIRSGLNTQTKLAELKTSLQMTFSVPAKSGMKRLVKTVTVSLFRISTCVTPMAVMKGLPARGMV